MRIMLCTPEGKAVLEELAVSKRPNLITPTSDSEEPSPSGALRDAE
jgi:hypothetical protein